MLTNYLVYRHPLVHTQIVLQNLRRLTSQVHLEIALVELKMVADQRTAVPRLAAG
jgi:hypothetical protein